MVLNAGISVAANNLPPQNFAERTGTEEERRRRQDDDNACNLWVAQPGQIVSFNAQSQTAVVQLLINQKIINKLTGATQWVSIKPIVDVPVMFPQAGSFVMTFPVTAGDEVIVVFQDRDIDGWWQSGGQQNWITRHIHDLSDGIAILGVNSLPNTIANANNGNNAPISTTATELRTKDGKTKISVGLDFIKVVTTEDTTGEIELAYGSSNSLIMNNSGTTINGPVTINGAVNMNSTVNMNSHGNVFFKNASGALESYSNHTHNYIFPSANAEGGSGPVGNAQNPYGTGA